MATASLAGPRLRPMDYGDILDFSIKIYLRHFVVLFLAFLLPYLPAYLLQTALQISTPSGPALFSDPGQLLSWVAGLSLASLVYLVAYPFALAATTQGISEAYLGRRPTLRSCYAGVLKRFWPLLGAVILSTTIIVGGLILLVIPGIYLAIAYLFIAPVVVLEGRSVWNGLERSRALVGGYFWKCLAVVLIVRIVITVLSSIVTLPVVFVFMASAISRQGAPPWQMQAMMTVVSGALNFFFGPFEVIARTLLYYDLRIRKEGFDLQVMAESLGLADETLVACPQCGSLSAPDSTFCGQCGTRLPAASAPLG